MIRQHNAITRNGSTIVMVDANNFEEAEALIVEQLSKPGREDVLKTWIDHGKLIEMEYTDSDDPAAIAICNQIMEHLRPAVL